VNDEEGTRSAETQALSEHAERPSANKKANAWAASSEGGTIESELIIDPPEGGIVIRRKVELIDKDNNVLQRFTERVWPAWVPGPDSGSSLTDFEKNWADASSQARATAKWIATILGLALAALIGSAPLSGIRNEYIPLRAYIIGGIGLVCIACTLFLVVRVLVPQITGFEDLISGKRPFKDLRERFQLNSGIFLPVRIRTFAELGGRARLEALTLDQLETRIEGHQGDPAKKEELGVLCEAHDGRTKWLAYLKQTAAQWAVVGSYLVVKDRVGWARILGLITGLAGTALIVIAFLMPKPQAPAVALTDYRLAHDSSTAAAQSVIGNKCAVFKGVVTGADSNSDLTILVQGSSTCNSASITIPGEDLVEIP
jgi:hypothetical protein